MNRRDFLKVGALTACASLLPTLKFKGAENWLADLVSTADAAYPTYPKKLWNARLNSGMPNLYTLYGMISTPQLNRTTVSGWTDGTNAEPDATWHQNFAANVVARNLAVKAIHFDHEDWPVSTQAERLATATKFANFARTFKTNLPTYQIGFYAYPLKVSIATGLYPGAGAFTTFQNANNDFAEVYPLVDYLCPSMYWYYTRKADPTYLRDYQVCNYWIVHLLEQRRLAKAYGTNQPIYPYVWERKASNPDLGKILDFDTMEAMYRINYQYADGLTIWGGAHDAAGNQATQSWATDTAATAEGAWWNNVLGPMITAGRFWNTR